MKSKLMRFIVMTLFATLVIPVRLAAQRQIRYTVTDLGTLGGTFSQAFGMNNKAWAVGYATLPGDTALHAFLWREGQMTDLGTLGGADTLPYSQALSVNERGEVVGFSETSDADPLGENFCGDSLVCLPFLWHNGVMTPLPTLGGTNGQAIGINNRGQIAGFVENTTRDPTCVPPQVLQFKPVLWEEGEVQKLPTVPGFPNGNAVAINNRGRATGVSGNCSLTASHALLWGDDEVTDLGTLPGLLLATSDVNNKGQVAGIAFVSGGPNVEAFLWKNGVVSGLGTLPGDAESAGSAVNDKGQVIGQSCDKSGFPHCSVFLWQNGVMTDLNTLIPRDSTLNLVDVGDINSRGEIVGLAIHKITGAFLAFLATPCDEDHADSEGCEDQAADTSATSQRPSVVVPESVRKLLLRQRLGHRSGIPGLATGPTN